MPLISTAPSTDADWQKLAEEVQRKLVIDETAGKGLVSSLTLESLAKTVDHTLLKLDATEAQIDALCEEAKKDKFATVCVRLNWVPRAITNLEGTGVGVACVVGFHEGTYTTEEKVKEATDAVAAGASELDVVINYPQLLAKQYAAVYTELITLRAATLPTPIKLILETSQLSTADIVAATTLAAYAGIDCVKTSTGFNGRGASVEDVRTMVGTIKAVGRDEGKERMWVKASGGVRGLESARAVLLAGAERIGTSSGVAILKEAREAVGANGVVGEGKKGGEIGAGY
ncbi:Deoxyribose-phosphate aldolase/phospho-2-dehydro-3-deoxyheptonate aldolase [Macrophomina phaseolina MS6]|uniref:deoxyribose-phosphate aldolase n=1 Tax=Macrophomina phaseolina (strain MS6) TaxID=1126212 RepID=K2S4G7_MACPH|nr:Deoxyribose-phosphate aldolase/phospho-2-dehydro-3-deoxyheptonate aldolase [Macrophomina phaseolina MS6]